MRIEGECDYCHAIGDWEGGIWDDPNEARGRPETWAAFFPTQLLPSELRETAWMTPEALERNGMTTRFACPNCHR